MLKQTLLPLLLVGVGMAPVVNTSSNSTTTATSTSTSTTLTPTTTATSTSTTLTSTSTTSTTITSTSTTLTSTTLTSTTTTIQTPTATPLIGEFISYLGKDPNTLTGAGNKLYAGHYGKTFVFDAETDEILYELEGHAGKWIDVVKVDKWGHVYTGASDRKVLRFNKDTNEIDIRINALGPVEGIYVDDDNIYVGVGWPEHSVKKFTYNGDFVADFRFIETHFMVGDGEYLFLGGKNTADGSIRQVRKSDMSLVRKIFGPAAGTTCGYADASEGVLTMTCSSGSPSIYRWRASDGELLFSRDINGFSLRGVVHYGGYALVGTSAGVGFIMQGNNTLMSFDGDYDGPVYGTAMIPPYVYISGYYNIRKYNASAWFVRQSSTITGTTTTGTTTTGTTTTPVITTTPATTHVPVMTTGTTTTATIQGAASNVAANFMGLDWSTVLIIIIASVLVIALVCGGIYLQLSVALGKNSIQETNTRVANFTTMMQNQSSITSGMSMYATGATSMTSLAADYQVPPFLQAESYRDYTEINQIDDRDGRQVKLVQPTSNELQQRASGMPMVAETVSFSFQMLSTKGQDAFNQELKMMWRFREHPFMCHVFGFSMSPAVILVKHYPLGTLAQFVHKRGETAMPPTFNYSARFIASTMKQICRCVVYVHAHGYVHLDLRPENFFLENIGDKLAPIMGGFGFAQPLEAPPKLDGNDGMTSMTAMTSPPPPAPTFELLDHTIRYVAPDLIERTRKMTEETNRTVWVADDCYSLAMMYHELMVRK